MPSKNSINKPNDSIIRNRKGIAAGRKRSSRPSAPERYSARAAPKSTALALYNGTAKSEGVLTTQTLSKKRQRKIERNKRYAEKRRNPDVEAMKIDDEPQESDKQTEGQKVQRVREALWTVASNFSGAKASFGEGTTLGGPVY